MCIAQSFRVMDGTASNQCADRMPTVLLSILMYSFVFLMRQNDKVLRRIVALDTV